GEMSAEAVLTAGQPFADSASESLAESTAEVADLREALTESLSNPSVGEAAETPRYIASIRDDQGSPLSTEVAPLTDGPADNSEVTADESAGQRRTQPSYTAAEAWSGEVKAEVVDQTSYVGYVVGTSPSMREGDAPARLDSMGLASAPEDEGVPES